MVWSRSFLELLVAQCRFEQIVSEAVPAIHAPSQSKTAHRTGAVRATCLCRLAEPPGVPCALVLTTRYGELAGPTVTLLSSRTGRIHTPQHPWLTCLRAALADAERSGHTVLTVRGTTADRWVCAARQLLACPVHQLGVRSLPPRWDSDPGTLVRRLGCQLAASTLSTVVLLPKDHCPFEPAADYVAAVLASRVLVLHARPGGNIDRLLQRLPLAERASWVDPAAHGLRTNPATAPRRPHHSGTEPAPVASVSWEDFLFHWTRAQTRGWPGEPSDAPLAKLLLGADSYDGFSALKRIADRGVIYASGSVQPCVSLTATAPTEWMDRRVYRRHRGRFDYELYGVAIHRAEVLAQGGLPVCYCEPVVYAHLPRGTRARFQPVCSPHNPRLRWTDEREWRVFDDLVLSVAPAGSVVFLARCREEARQIIRVSGRPCAYFCPC